MIAGKRSNSPSCCVPENRRSYNPIIRNLCLKLCDYLNPEIYNNDIIIIVIIIIIIILIIIIVIII